MAPQNHRKPSQMAPKGSHRGIRGARCALLTTCCTPEGVQGSSGCRFSLHLDPAWPTLGAVLGHNGCRWAPKDRPKSCRKVDEKTDAEKIWKNMKKSCKIDQNSMPESMKTGCRCGTLKSLFFAKSITLKSFFHMTRGVENPRQNGQNAIQKVMP